MAAADPIALTECSILKSRMGDSLLHSNISITKLSKKVDIQPNLGSTDAMKEINLAELQTNLHFKLRPSQLKF